MTKTKVPARCRLVLIAPPGDAETTRDAIEAALAGGDVASLILPRRDLDDVGYQRLAEDIVPRVQATGVAAVLEGDARIAMRTGADGVHFEGNAADLADLVERQRKHLAIGTGGAKTRDDALRLGEAQPDYIFFGRFGYDTKPEPHHRNLALGEWWSQMIAIPCILLGGSDVASVVPVAQCGAEFVALEQAVFGVGADPKQRVAEINALLDAEAPRLVG